MRRFLIWFALAFVFWVAGMVAFYYVVHKPWEGDQLAALFQAGRDIVVAISITALAGGMGRRLCSLPGFHEILTDAAPLERFGISTAVGLGILSLVVLAAGMVGVLGFWPALTALLAGIIFLRRDILAWAKDLRDLKTGEPMSNLEKLSGAFILAVITLNLLRALAPPLKWDSLVYHLQIPQAYLEAGRIFLYAENLYTAFPQAVEVLFAWAMALGSATTGAVLGWVVGVVAFLCVEGFSRRVFRPGVRWLAPAILLSGYSIAQALNWAYLELWVLLYGTVVLLAVDHYYRNGKRAWLMLAGILIGLVIGIKYTAGVLLFIVAILLLPVWCGLLVEKSSNLLSRLSWRNWFSSMFLIGSLAAVMVVPWLLKNLIFVRNPLFPVIVFDQQVNPWQQAFRSSLPTPRTIWDDFLLPFDATIFGYEAGEIEGKPGYSANLGVLLLALIPGLGFSWNNWDGAQKRTLRMLLLTTISAWVLWSIAAHFADELMRSRHWFGVFGGLAVLAVAGFQAASRLHFPAFRLGKLLEALVILSLSLALLTEILDFSRANPIPVVFGSQSQEDYLDQELGWYHLAMRVVNQLPEDSVVLFLWEPRILYCRVECLTDGTLDNWWYLRQAAGGVDGVASVLSQRGITHVLISEVGLEWIWRETREFDPAWQDELEYFRQNHLVLQEQLSNVYSLYRFDGDK